MTAAQSEEAAFELLDRLEATVQASSSVGLHLCAAAVRGQCVLLLLPLRKNKRPHTL